MPNKNQPEKIEIKKESNSEEKNNLSFDEDKIPSKEESLQYFGQKIRETRISNNLSLESISGHLHISVKILKAIEEGKPENGPTSVFFRGLVRTYCQFLELDKVEIIEKIDTLLKEESSKEDFNTKPLKPVFKVRESHNIRNVGSVVLIFVCFVIVYFIFFSKDENLSDIQNKVVEDVNTIKKSVVTELEVNQSNEISQGKNPNDSPISPERKKENNKLFQSSISTNKDEPLTLEIEASKGTWISLAIDDNDVKDYRIKSDQIKQWDAEKNFLLTIGNTKVIRVLLNGREIETDRSKDLLLNWTINSNLLP